MGDFAVSAAESDAILAERTRYVACNAFGESVWLKACLNDMGERIGITECCFAFEPCERHVVGVYLLDAEQARETA